MALDALSPVPSTFGSNAPEIAVEPVPRCPVCAASARSHFAHGHDYELQTCRNEWQLWQCDECGTVWLDPRPSVETLSVIYPPHYYSYAMTDTVSPLALKGKTLLDHLKFRSILAQASAPPRSYLDIGCGDGRYLQLFADRGIPKTQIYGLELSDEPVQRLRAQGFQAYLRRVEDCTEIPPDSIDLATMFHVIEHVADPLQVVKRVAEWLAPGGLLAIETPNIGAWDARLFKDRWWGGYHIPRHWTLFDPASLNRLLQGAGLEVTHLAYQTGHSFWMYSMHHLLRYGGNSPRLARWFDPLRNNATLIAFTGFDILRRTAGAPTSAMLMIARKPGPPLN